MTYSKFANSKNLAQHKTYILKSNRVYEGWDILRENMYRYKSVLKSPREYGSERGAKGGIISKVSLETFCACSWQYTRDQSSKSCYSSDIVDVTGQYETRSPEKSNGMEVQWLTKTGVYAWQMLVGREPKSKLGRRHASAGAHFISEICGFTGQIVLFPNYCAFYCNTQLCRISPL